MSTNSLATTKWLKYFAAAGIPSNAAANYAVIFTENRIQPDMLLDLNKEYLYDMGIRVMGDVIAILRYARTAYTEEAQKKILGEASSLNPRPPLAESEKKSQPSLKRTVSSYDTPSDRLSAKIEKPKALPVKKGSNSPVKVKKVVLLKRSVNELDYEDSNESPPERTNKVQKLSTKTVITDTKSVEKKSTVVKGSVFRRLGESSVSSSTDSVPVSVQPTSIFERLGPSKTKSVSQPASSTVNESTLNLNTSSKNQSYKGVLKTFTVQREIVNPVAGSVTTGAELRGKSSIGRIQLKKTVKNRLGTKPTSSSTVSTTSETIFNTQRRLLQRSLADVESQNRKTIVKLSQRPNPAVVKSRLSSGITFNTTSTLKSPRLSSGITLNTSTSRTSSRRLLSDTISTSERIVKKPKAIFTKPKQSIFSRLGPV